MNWKLKVVIQNIIAKFPPRLSYKIYYFVQRKFGALRKPVPVSRLSTGRSIAEIICNQGRAVESKTFLEIGTGWRLNVPIALWLCGAAKIITVDLNPFLKSELVFKDISYIRNNQEEIKELFGNYSHEPIFQDRLNRLIAVRTNLNDLFDILNVQYLAPADARLLDLRPQSVDYHVSNNVFEHIPLVVLESILLEGKRLLKKEGLFVHLIDLSDHHSHKDKSISAINFLQFSKSEWVSYTNKFTYHNRLRIDDYKRLFDKNLKVLFLDTTIDQRSLEELQKGFSLDKDFKDKSEETNAIRDVTIVASSEASRPN